MSLQNPTAVVTEERLNEYHQTILPYLGGTAEAGFTPVGTIISVMGNSAPANYLSCNGQIVNIADYPILADYFEQQFGTKNKFGGDGTTTFGIPDLRGEFLRGTGTNSHTNQGNGANVGTHQDSTEIPFIGINTSNREMWIPSNHNIDGASNFPRNVDKNLSDLNKKTGITYSSNGTYSGDGLYGYSLRPTNTSVLYCIATHNIYLNPSLDYSTTEKIIGTWIDGKPIYQKTWTGLNATIPRFAWSDTVIDTSGLNIKYLIDYRILRVGGNGLMIYIPEELSVDNNSLGIYGNNTERTISTVTLRYTKTTD